MRLVGSRVGLLLGVCSLGLLGSLGVAAAQTRRVVVARPQTIGIEPSAGDVFADLLRGELAKEGYAVIPMASTPPEPCADPPCGAQIAQQTQSELAVVLSISALGTRIIVRVTMVDAAGQPVFNDRASGEGLEDLDPLATRVAAAIAQNRPIEDTATVSTVTAGEAREPVRRKALFTTGVRFGMFVPMANGYGGASVLADIGGVAMYELKSMAIMAEFDLKWSTQDDDADVFAGGGDLGLRFFTSEDDTGLFFGGGFGFRGIAISDGFGTGDSDADSGLGGYAGGGVVFLRTADVHIIVDARYDVNLFELDALSQGRRTHGFLISAGFSYTKGMRGLFGR